MSTYTQIYFHIVYSTKNRERLLWSERREELLRYAWGVIKNRKCHLYRINAVEDHMHMFTHLHPSLSLSDFVKEVKTALTGWIKQNAVFPGFSNWQDGYGAFTHSHAEKDRLIEYVKNQAEHHKTVTFEEELRRLLKEAGIEFDERFLL